MLVYHSRLRHWIDFHGMQSRPKNPRVAWLIRNADRPCAIYSRAILGGQEFADTLLQAANQWPVHNPAPHSAAFATFRMLDDDGNVCASGIIWRRADDIGSESDFNPLDHYGEHEFGCTTIQYWINGEWADL